MTTAVPDILARIVEHKRAELAGVRPLRERFEQRIAGRRGFRDFAAAIGGGLSIVAEIKKASPSKGVLAREFDPSSIARAYERGGAAALSVLTDKQFFQGSLADLDSARGACRLPALRKDFTIDAIQILEAAAHGADAILLIAAILSDFEMASFRQTAADLGMAALVEVHDEIELERAVGSGAKIIGVNNRDLRTFDVRLETSLRLAARIPAGVLRVSESGIHSRESVALLRGAGYDAFLIGESLMTSGDPERSLRELLA
jgi:indole-3-glycerol phosphate synthase